MVLVVCATLLVIALASCSPVSNSAIVGKWESLGPVGKGDKMEFTSAGTFTRMYVDQSNGKSISGSYTVVSKTKVEISVDLIDDRPIKDMKNVRLPPQIYDFEVRGDRFDLTAPDGEIEHLRKLKEP